MRLSTCICDLQFGQDVHNAFNIMIYILIIKFSMMNLKDKHIYCQYINIFICPSLRRDVLWYTNVRLSVCLSVLPFHMSRSNWRTPRPIHFKLRIVIGIDSLMVCILFGEISIFHSRVMGLYSSNCRRFFVCRTVNWEPLHQFTSNFVLLLELIVFTDFSKKCCFQLYKYCINVPIHVYGAAVGEI